MFTKSNLDGFMCIDCGIDDCIRYLYEEVFKEEINLLYLPPGSRMDFIVWENK